MKKLLGFRPGKLSFFRVALTHRSMHNGLAGLKSDHNERLEYLGDAILNAVVADFVFRQFPQADEGVLTRARADLVNRDFLNDQAHRLGIGPLLHFHSSLASLPRDLLGNALEALVGAVFLDKGYSQAVRFVETKLLPPGKGPKAGPLPDLPFASRNGQPSFKNLFNEWAQKNRVPYVYQTMALPDNPKVFQSELVIKQEVVATGRGASKKEAEQEAARLALANPDSLNPENFPPCP